MFVAEDCAGPIITLNNNQCRYPTPLHQPYGKVTIFCGKPAVPGTSWCKEHKSRVLMSRSEVINKIKIEDKLKLNHVHISS